MKRYGQNYYGGWPGHEHIQYSGDYHVDGKEHLPLEELAKQVAQQQSSNKSS